jgi:predicted molibdopterin-dependent oxidoreductase YjgC
MAVTPSAASLSRCTNEETYLVQKLIHGGFGNNNVDTCACVAIRQSVTACRRRLVPAGLAGF